MGRLEEPLSVCTHMHFAHQTTCTPPPPCDIPLRCCFFTGPWTVTRPSLRMLRRVAAFCRPLRPVLLLVSFPRSRSPVVGVPGLCWMWRDVPFVRQRRRVVGVLGVVLVVAGVTKPQAPPPPHSQQRAMGTSPTGPTLLHSHPLTPCARVMPTTYAPDTPTTSL